MSEKLKEIIENMPKDILINSFETVYEDSIKKDLEIKRLNNIIDKAIEYIEENSDDMHTYISQVLTDILKGSDKE